MAEDLVQVARALAPIIRGGAEEADRERRLPTRVARAMAEAGLYRMSVAREYGGLEADPVTTIKVIEAISEADGAAGWNLMIGTETSGISSGGVIPEVGQEVWGADPAAIMSGALNALGRAAEVEGGWRVNGQWPFASGCHNATWFWGGCQVVEGGDVRRNADGTPFMLQVLVPASDFTILDTWQVAGLRGSGSHDIAVTDVFVPIRRTTAVHYEGLRAQSPLFRYPLISRLCYNKVGVATGIARAAIDAFVELAGAKVPYTARELLRERAHAQLTVAEAEALLGSGRAFIFETVGEMWEEVRNGRRPPDALRVRQRLAASYCVDCAVRAVELVHKSAGSTANFTSSPIERLVRDVHVVQAHVTVAPTIFETVGRAMLGLPVNPGSF